MRTLPASPASITPPSATMSLTAVTSRQALVPPVPLILWGRNERGQPHGSRFDDHQLADVEQAARLMGFRLVAAETDGLRSLGAKLPAGRIFSSGKAFVPFIRGELYDRLVAATGTPEMPLPRKASARPAEGGPIAGGGQGRGAGGGGAGEPPAPVTKQAPADWSKIEIGSLVLAKGDDGDDGYYAAKVISVGTDDKLSCVWANYPDLPRFMRPRKTLALLHPEATATSA